MGDPRGGTTKAGQASALTDRAIRLELSPEARELLGTEERVYRIEVNDAGRLVIKDSSPLAHMSKKARDRLAMSVLEQRWLRGNLQALSMYQTMRRFEIEQEKGRAAMRIQHDVSGSITVVNDLAPGLLEGRTQPVDIMQSYRTLDHEEAKALPAKTGADRRLESLKKAREALAAKRRRAKEAAGGTPGHSGSHRDSSS